MFLCNKCFLIGCRSDAVVDTLFVVCQAVNLFNFRYFEQTFTSAIVHAMLSNFLSSFALRLILICDFRHICAYLSGDICTTYTIFVVLLRFSRTHLSRSEVLTCLHLSHCFAKVRGWRRKRCFNLIAKATICFTRCPIRAKLRMQRPIKHSQAKFVCVNVQIIVRNPLYLPNIPMLTPYLTTLIKIRVCNRMNFCSLKVTVHQPWR